LKSLSRQRSSASRLADECSDERDLLITSANFTWTGLNSDIECGVRLVDSKSGRQAIEFVQHLRREGLLVAAAV
jgi:phosphatidylserine/phosphatidylglycerophosphate/cardiolipin synthase-like enzyme